MIFNGELKSWSKSIKKLKNNYYIFKDKLLVVLNNELKEDFIKYIDEKNYDIKYICM